MRKHPEPIQSKNPPRITLYRCREGHVYFQPHPSCPDCEGRLEPTKTWGKGILITHTTIEITPTGKPLTIGIVRHRGGAQSLCRIIGDIRGNGKDRVSILCYGGLYYAFGRSVRIAYRGDRIRSLPVGVADIPIP